LAGMFILQGMQCFMLIGSSVLSSQDIFNIDSNLLSP
jgi:hypothetical protein